MYAPPPPNTTCYCNPSDFNTYKYTASCFFCLNPEEPDASDFAEHSYDYNVIDSFKQKFDPWTSADMLSLVNENYCADITPSNGTSCSSITELACKYTTMIEQSTLSAYGYETIQARVRMLCRDRLCVSGNERSGNFSKSRDPIGRSKK